MAKITPIPLVPGDEIHIISTARFVDKEFIDFARQVLENKGFKVLTGSNLFNKNHQFAGSDTERLADLNAAIRNPKCRAILCARGGYGTARLVDELDLISLKSDPKWIAGYSDITALLNHVYNQIGLESIHSTMPVNFSTNTSESIDSLVAALTGKELYYQFPKHELNRAGEAEGNLIGGNLSVIYSLLGSPSSLQTDGKILFLEDLDEYLYHIDRMMLALDRSCKLENLAGLIIGGMSDMNDNTVPFGQTAEEIISERVSKYKYPVAFGFPAGHLSDNRAWIHGKKRRLIVSNDQPSEVN